MPCRLRIKIYEASGLPVNTQGNANIDSPGSFVEVKFSDFAPYKTTNKKSLNPVWKEDFRYEITKDKIIQDDPVELRVRWGEMGDDIIGVVYIDINSLLMNSGPTFINGWFPIYDTYRGIRGLLHALIKLEFVDNINQFRDSSAGLKFFSIDEAITNYDISKIIGLVSDIVIVNDLPESKYSQRASNEQRQRLLYQISGKLRRKIGIKVQKMGGNSVLGYHQHIEFEGGDNPIIVATGYGSASIIKKIARETTSTPSTQDIEPRSSQSPLGTTPPNVSYLAQNPLINTSSTSLPSTSTSNTNTNVNAGISLSQSTEIFVRSSDSVHISTIKKIPAFLSFQFGAIVSARSIKVLHHGNEAAVRYTWWEALREEIRSHARSLNCDLILGYSESFTSNDDIAILSVMGTACKFILNSDSEKPKSILDSPSHHATPLSSSSESLGALNSSFENLTTLLTSSNFNLNQSNNNLNNNNNGSGNVSLNVSSSSVNNQTSK